MGHIYPQKNVLTTKLLLNNMRNHTVSGFNLVSFMTFDYVENGNSLISLHMLIFYFMPLRPEAN